MTIKHATLEQEQEAILGSRDEQIKLLEHFQDHEGPGFRSFFASWELGSDTEVLMPPKQWCEEVFRTHPWEDDEIEGDHQLFQRLSRHELRQTAVWYNIHVKMVEKGVLKSHFFAYDRAGKKSSGLNNIKQALATKADTDKIEKCARNILRNMGGIPRDRGYRTTLINCPTAQFYWNYLFACDIEEQLKSYELADSTDARSRKDKRRRIYEILQGPVWEGLVEALESKITIFSNKRILAAFVAYIIEVKEEYNSLLRKEGATEANERKEALNNVLKSLGPSTSVRHLSLADPSEILKVFKKVKI